MDEKTKKISLVVAAVAIIGVLIVAAVYGGWFKKGEDVQTLKVGGSTTVLPIAQKAAETYMDKHPNVDIQVSGGGSSVGVKGVSEGTLDIGDASRELKESEQGLGLVKNVVARDGITIIVHPSNPITALTLDQIKGIYNGTYTNWKQLGGNDQKIVVVNRDSASGTRETFDELVMHKEDFVSTALEKNSNGAVKQTVVQTPGAIGYVGMGYVDSSVKAVNINANGQTIKPTIENVQNGKYPISRDLNMFTKGAPKGLAKDFIEFIQSDEGQKIVEKEGFIPLK